MKRCTFKQGSHHCGHMTQEALKRIRSILSAVTGLDDDDDEYIGDARKAVDQLIDKLDSQPQQEPVGLIETLTDIQVSILHGDFDCRVAAANALGALITKFEAQPKQQNCKDGSCDCCWKEPQQEPVYKYCDDGKVIFTNPEILSRRPNKENT